MHKKLNASFSGSYSPIFMPENWFSVNILKIKIKIKFGAILGVLGVGANMPLDFFYKTKIIIKLGIKMKWEIKVKKWGKITLLQKGKRFFSVHQAFGRSTARVYAGRVISFDPTGD